MAGQAYLRLSCVPTWQKGAVSWYQEGSEHDKETYVRIDFLITSKRRLGKTRLPTEAINRSRAEVVMVADEADHMRIHQTKPKSMDRRSCTQQTTILSLSVAL